MVTKNKKVMTDKYYAAEEVEAEVKKVLDSYGDRFTHFDLKDIKFVFKTAKNNPSQKHVTVRIIKEPMTLLTSKKIMFIVTDSWWNDEIGPSRMKALIEGLISIDFDKNGNLSKRKFDIQTFSDLIQGGKLDYGKFSKVIPSDQDLVLS